MNNKKKKSGRELRYLIKTKQSFPIKTEKGHSYKTYDDLRQ